ncbi:MAG: hypothetical protein IPK15_13410 [Verrucomicrobia bacterium]|nr:hypothetical protein [Verrucomicrobiota bacterium]
MFTTIPLLLAQASIDGSIDNFLKLLAKLMLLPAVAMLIYAGLLMHDGKTREAINALIGAFVLAAAIPIARFLFTLV